KDNSLVKYTNTKWLTPNGDWIHEKGLEPDFVINTPDFYRVKFLDSEDAYIESQSNDDIISIKVMLDALGYDVDTIDNNFNSNLRWEEHTSELQSRFDLVCRLLLEIKK